MDYIVKSLVCHKCMKHQQDEKTSKDYINWWELHKPSCLINHSGSSNSIESEGACEIFLRSIEKDLSSIASLLLMEMQTPMEKQEIN